MLGKQKIIVASGYFDPIHVGHIDLLKCAKDICQDSKLIVIVNNDKQAIAKKGYVFMKQNERKEIIENLSVVDEAVISIDSDRTVCKTLEKINPDIFANGGDRNNKEVPEYKVCKENNIKMIDNVGGIKKQSSSKLILDAISHICNIDASK